MQLTLAPSGGETSYEVVKWVLRHLTKMLFGHVCQVVLFLVRSVMSPHDKDDLGSLRAQRAQGPMVAVATAPLPAIVGTCPLAALQRAEGQPVEGIAQVGITRKAEAHPLLFPAALRDGHRAGVGLQVGHR